MTFYSIKHFEFPLVRVYKRNGFQQVKVVSFVWIYSSFTKQQRQNTFQWMNSLLNFGIRFYISVRDHKFYFILPFVLNICTSPSNFVITFYLFRQIHMSLLLNITVVKPSDILLHVYMAFKFFFFCLVAKSELMGYVDTKSK